MANPWQEIKTQVLEGLETYWTSERPPNLPPTSLEETRKRKVIDVLKTMPSKLSFG